MNLLIRATFESAPDGIVLLAGDGRILAFNPRFLTLWNFPPDMLARLDPAEMRAHTASQLRDPAAYFATLDAVRSTARAQVFDTVALADGRYFERHVSPLDVPDVAGGIVVRWRDISDRIATERALTETQRRLSALFEHALNAILMADDQGRYVDANPAACALLGCDREGLIGLSVDQVVVPGTLDIGAAWGGFLRDKRSRGRVQLKRRDGSIVVAQFSAVADVLPGVHLSVLSDVTEEARSQQRQQELTTLLDLAMTAADIAFWDVDLREMTVRSTSEYWHSMLGYAGDEMPTRLADWARLVHPDDRQARRRAWHDHVEGRTERYECEFRLRHRDGHWIWLQARGLTVARDASGRPVRVVGTRMDISRRKQTEQQLEAMAHTDSLTGVYNRRRFFQLGQEEMQRTLRYQEPLAVLMIDLDRFKQVNDRFGHAGGDAVLCSFVQTLRTVLRQVDIPGRLGGEEFAVLLPHTSLLGAQAIAARVLAATRAEPAQVGAARVAYTVSIGVSGADAPAAATASIETLLQSADRALYRAKAAGRDRWEADPTVVP